MDVLFFILMVILLIVGIISLVFILRKVINNAKGDYKEEGIVSCIFPLVGLIIYAVNIGNNKSLAKKCLNMAIYGMLCALSIVVIIYSLIAGIKIFFEEKTVSVYGQRVSYIKEDNQSNSEELEKLKNILLENMFITDCDIDTVGSIIYINIEYKQNDYYDIKSIINSAIEECNLDRDYDYEISINDELIGVYIKGIDSINWKNN